MIARDESLLRGTYEDLAAEYYDADRHPTSANFREASAEVLSDYFESIELDNALICEVGAGKSLCAEFLSSRSGLEQLVLVDSSPSMLAYSKTWCAAGARCIVASAEKLPLESETVGTLVSILGDPYNTPRFWSEASRVLRQGGRAVFTTPSHQWAGLFRRHQAEGQTWSEFELSTGQILLVPSYIYRRKEQIDLIRASGLTVDAAFDRPLSSLESSRISSKLMPERGPNAPVITAYFIQKHR